MDHTLFVGLDAGGSKTALVAAVGDGEVVYEASGTGVNLQRSGRDAASSALAAATREVLERFPQAATVYACAGVAGAGRADEAEQLAAQWTSHFSTETIVRVSVVHDGVIALEGAFAGESGAIVIAGTGSLVLLRSRRGALERAGGWGFLLGDEGSGYAIGLAGLRAVASAIDGGPATALSGVLAERYGLVSRDDLIRSVYRDQIPLQSLAPVVLETAGAGDAVCGDVAGMQAAVLADQLAWLGHRESDVVPRVAFVGGLVSDDYYRAVLTDAIRNRLPDWEISDPLEPPVRGALRLARRLRQPVP